MEMEKRITVELTVPPTILHAGVFLAEKKGYYAEEGIQLKLNWPTTDNNTGREDMRSAVNELSNHKADIIIAGFSTVIHYNHLVKETVPLVAISSLQYSSSSSPSTNGCTAIATLKSSGIDNLEKLNHKRVAIFGYPFEEGIMKEMVKREGGSDVKFELPPVQHIYDGLKNRKYEAAHLVIPWHGVKARRDNIMLNFFKLDDYDIPSHYPCFVTLKDALASGHKKVLFKSFLRATLRGYDDLMKDDPRRIAEQLKEWVNHDNMRDVDFIRDCIAESREYFGGGSGGDGGEKSRWGTMNQLEWRAFVRFLSEKKLLVTDDGRPVNESHININSLFTNELLE